MNGPGKPSCYHISVYLQTFLAPLPLCTWLCHMLSLDISLAASNSEEKKIPTTILVLWGSFFFFSFPFNIIHYVPSVPRIVLGTGCTTESGTDKILCQKGAYFLIWEIDNKQDKKTHSALAGGIRYRGCVGERGEWSEKAS